MPVYSGIGVYSAYAEDSAREGDEVSSTYEGRHLTFLASDITGQDTTLVTKGRPVVVGEHIVGVAFETEVAAADLIPIDTEGVFLLEVVATDEDGNNAVVAGDELFIHKTNAVISKNANKVTHTRFGYALGNIDAASTAVIAVKVHWNPADEYELVGQQGAASVGADASHRFREYHFQATGGGYPHGFHIELNVGTVACASAQALVAKIRWTNDDNWVTGYCAAGEFEVEVGGGAGLIDNMYCIHLTSHIGVLTMTTTSNVETAWIAIDEYAIEGGSQLRNLLRIVDTDSDYPYTTDSATLFSTSGDMATSHVLRIMVNNVAYWILCSDTYS